MSCLTWIWVGAGRHLGFSSGSGLGAVWIDQTLNSEVCNSVSELSARTGPTLWHLARFVSTAQNGAAHLQPVTEALGTVTVCGNCVGRVSVGSTLNHSVSIFGPIV